MKQQNPLSALPADSTLGASLFRAGAPSAGIVVVADSTVRCGEFISDREIDPERTRSRAVQVSPEQATCASADLPARTFGGGRIPARLFFGGSNPAQGAVKRFDWGRHFLRSLSRGYDNGYAAYLADRAERKASRET